MDTGSTTAAKREGGFLTRLVRDVRANTLVIMTMALIPLAGMVGGGLDVSRMYILKTRLQHACDAGALAGRKSMGGGTWSQNSNYPNAQAVKFFDGNMKSGQFGSYAQTRTFAENAGKVTGSAQATIPMTLMKIFRVPDQVISVTCQAEMRLPNTDIMFVLDTTGSMAESAGGGQTKIQALRTAVKCFYEIVARLNTDANCTTGTPSGGTGNQVQIRFGFVPYSTNVNVGRLLPPSYFADQWSYQTREAVYTDQPGANQWVQQSQTSSTGPGLAQNGIPQDMCNDATAEAYKANTSEDEYTDRNRTKTNTSVVIHVTGWSSNSNKNTCYYKQTTTTTVYKWQPGPSTKVFSQWHYARLPVDISLLKDGTNWRSSFQWPVGSDGNNKTISWGGCIEERQTVKQSSYSPIPSDAKDLDIDLVPTSDVSTQWAPVLPDLIFTRDRYRDSSNRLQGSWDANEATTATEYVNDSDYFCPTEAKKLQPWPDPNTFDDYVDSLNPTGNTYHDIGLIWGARFASPDGMFSATNKFTPQGGEIERHIIFMTDGETNAINTDYAAYGIPWFDRRQTNSSSAPSNSTLNAQVDARFAALCTAVKNKNITLWVIGFGSDIVSNTAIQTRLTNCASPGRYFLASDGAALQTTFKNIADQISMLRLTN